MARKISTPSADLVLDLVSNQEVNAIVRDGRPFGRDKIMVWIPLPGGGTQKEEAPGVIQEAKNFVRSKLQALRSAVAVPAPRRQLAQ